MPDQPHPPTPPEPDEPRPRMYHPGTGQGGTPDGSPRARQKSSAGQIWLGIALSIVVTVLSGLITTLTIPSLESLPGSVVVTVSTLFGAVVFLAPIVMLFFARTRMVAVGLLIGFAVQVILTAGACVLLLTALAGMNT